MDPQEVVDIGREALFQSLTVALPVLLAGVVVGLFVSFVQALTQINDQTVTFVPKMVAMLAVLAFTMPWLLQSLMEYTRGLFESIPHSVLGG
jgi:flagellar biosynthetic protein FliQ